jgi:chlorophyllide a reductase subunit Z
MMLFGSINERMYAAEAGGRSHYIPASFPGAVIRRHTGTPFMGYGGATYLVQEICNGLFDALFHVLPLASSLDAVSPTPVAVQESPVPWTLEAQQALEAYLARQPVLIRISEAKRLRDAAEQAARSAGLSEVTLAALALPAAVQAEAPAAPPAEGKSAAKGRRPDEARV